MMTKTTARAKDTVVPPSISGRVLPSRRRGLTKKQHPTPTVMSSRRSNVAAAKNKDYILATGGTHASEPAQRPISSTHHHRPPTPTIRLALGRSRTRKEVEYLCHSMGLSPHTDQVHQLDGISSSQHFEVDVSKMWQTRIKQTQINVAARSPRNKLAVVI